MKIGVFDSGRGGMSILEELREVLPYEDFLYYGDSINNPYGEKSDEELMTITTKIVDYLKENDCRVIVIACNTATTRCMKKLRKMQLSYMKKKLTILIQEFLKDVVILNS